jgi:hypothetical protein
MFGRSRCFHFVRPNRLPAMPHHFRDLSSSQRTAAAETMRQLVQAGRTRVITREEVYLLLTLNPPVFKEELSVTFTPQAIAQVRNGLREK